MLLQLFIISITALAFGQDAAPEDIKPSDCNNTHFLIQEGGTIQIRIRPKSLPFGQHFPEQCNLTFVVPKPWTDILFSFSHCDNEGMDPPCGEEWTKYSYITNSGVLFSINNNSDVNECLNEYDSQTPPSTFSQEGAGIHLGSTSVNVLLSISDPSSRDWALYFNMTAGYKRIDAFSYAIGVFTLALGSTTVFILLVLCCCCCGKCCCWSERIQQSNRAAQRRKMINALRKDGYFVSPDYGSTRVRDPMMPQPGQEQTSAAVAPPQPNPASQQQYEPPPSYDSVRQAYQTAPPSRPAAATNFAFVVDNPRPTITVDFSNRVSSAAPQQPVIPEATHSNGDAEPSSAANPFLDGSVPEGVLIDIDVQPAPPAPAFGAADQPVPPQEDLIRFEPEQHVDLLFDINDTENVPPPAFGSVE